MKPNFAVPFLLILLVLSLGACKGPGPTDSPLVSPLESPLPLPAATTLSNTSQITGPSFELDRPILPGATEVSGQGPTGLTVAIMDMTMMGNPLGSGTIGPDARFAITLVEPAILNHVIGVQVVADREFTADDIEQLLRRRGPGFKNYPQVGEAFDTVVVRNPD